MLSTSSYSIFEIFSGGGGIEKTYLLNKYLNVQGMIFQKDE